MIWRFPKKKFWPAEPGEIFLGGQVFQFFFLKKRRRSKIQNPARGSKSPSRGGGVDLNWGGGNKKSNQVGVYTPLTPPSSPMSSDINWIAKLAKLLNK